MSIIFPKLEELYSNITNDCYIYTLQQNNKNQKILDKELFVPIKNKTDIIKRLEVIKNSISNHMSKNQKYSYINTFTSKYICTIMNFYSKNQTINIELKYYDQFCLAYIALVGYCCFYSNIDDDDELFIFHSEKYKNFSKFLLYYSIANPLKEYYEEHSFKVKKDCNDESKLYLCLIIKFDSDHQYYPMLISVQQNEKEEMKNNLIKEINQINIIPNRIIMD